MLVVVTWVFSLFLFHLLFRTETKSLFEGLFLFHVLDILVS